MRCHCLLLTLLAAAACVSCQRREDILRDEAGRWMRDVKDRLYAGGPQTQAETRRDILAALSAPEWHKRAAAASLGHYCGDDAAEPLIRCLADENPNVRSAAIASLGQLKDARAVEPLIGLLGDPQMQFQAKQALVRIGEPAVEPLLAAVPRQSSPAAGLAVEALGEIADPRALQPLIGMLGRGELQGALVRAIACFGPAAVPRLANEFPNGSHMQRFGAAVALGAIGDPAGVGPLIAALPPAECDERTRRAIVESLVRIGVAGVPNILAALPAAPPERQQYLAAALGQIGDPQAAGALAALLACDAGRVRWEAAAALRRIGKPATDALLAALAAAEPLHRWQIVAVLYGIQGTSATALLLSRAGDGALPMPARQAAAEAAICLTTPEPAPVQQALSHDDDLVVEAALRLLAVHPDTWRAMAGVSASAMSNEQPAREKVTALLAGDPRPAIRRVAAAVLAVGYREDVPALIAALKDQDATVRAAAAEGLGELCAFCQPPPGAVVYPPTPADLRAEEPLMLNATDAAPIVRAAVAAALGRLGPAGERRTEVLLAALRDEQWPVREAAATALCQSAAEQEAVRRALARVALDAAQADPVRAAALPALLGSPEDGRRLIARIGADPLCSSRLRAAARRPLAQRWYPVPPTLAGSPPQPPRHKRLTSQ